MPFAIENQISTEPIDGGIEITDQQYQEALAGMMAGKLVSIDGGFAVIDPPEPEVEPEPEPGPLTGDQVDSERERRIALPLEVTLSVGTITINMDPNAQRNIQGLASVGQYLVTTGSSQTTAFRDYDNASHDLTPVDLITIGLQVAQRIQAVYAKSWIIKSMDPIPDNYADDVWW